MDVKGEIYNVSLCSATPEGKDPILEISVYLHFKALEFPELVGKTEEEMAELFSGDEAQSLSMARGSSIRKGSFNIDFEEGEFKGQQFSSATVGMVKDIGAVIKLHVTLPYADQFWAWIPGNFRKVIDMRITEINEQMSLPESGVGEEG